MKYILKSWNLNNAFIKMVFKMHNENEVFKETKKAGVLEEIVCGVYFIGNQRWYSSAA